MLTDVQPAASPLLFARFTEFAGSPGNSGELLLAQSFCRLPRMNSAFLPALSGW